MRNLLDTTSFAQSLDGERLMGCLHYPGRIIFPDLFDYKDRTHIDQSLIEFDIFMNYLFWEADRQVNGRYGQR